MKFVIANENNITRSPTALHIIIFFARWMDGSDPKPRINIKAFSEKIAQYYDFRYTRSIERTITVVKNRIQNNFDNSRNPDEGIIKTIRLIGSDLYVPLIADIRGGLVYNIEPSKVKNPDDSAKRPGIHKDGSGLYSTLYAIKKYKEYPNARYLFRAKLSGISNINKITMQNILKYTQLANEWIDNIDVVNNPFDKQLQIRVEITGGKFVPILPLSAMSDGTVKWIAMITIILTRDAFFSIEEPENYLHPHMQSEIMSIMRAHIATNRFILMSTHSETILNNATPNEIVVVSYQDGKTIAKRVSNAEDLNREIMNTGFGLGYYYMAGSIENE